MARASAPVFCCSSVAAGQDGPGSSGRLARVCGEPALCVVRMCVYVVKVVCRVMCVRACVRADVRARCALLVVRPGDVRTLRVVAVAIPPTRSQSLSPDSTRAQAVPGIQDENAVAVPSTTTPADVRSPQTAKCLLQF